MSARKAGRVIMTCVKLQQVNPNCGLGRMVVVVVGVGGGGRGKRVRRGREGRAGGVAVSDRHVADDDNRKVLDCYKRCYKLPYVLDF